MQKATGANPPPLREKYLERERGRTKIGTLTGRDPGIVLGHGPLAKQVMPFRTFGRPKFEREAGK